MSDETIDPTAPEPAADPDNEVIRTLREQAKEGKKAQARNVELEKELAFMRAGIDATDPRVEYFARGYQGEMTADAIKAEAERIGVLTTSAPTTPAGDAPQGLDQATRDALAASTDAALGGGDPPPPTDLYADFRGATHMATREDPQNFAMRLAQHLEAKGEFVAYEGGQRKTPLST